MKKLSLLYPVIVLAALFCILYTSCKKPLHSNAPTPGNYRLKSYTATTQLHNSLPVFLSDTTSQNYAFTYDAYNRVSQITFSTNDTSYVNAGKNIEIITFNYSNDTIYKTITNVPENTFFHATFEMDTLIINTQTNLITTIYTPGLITTLEYYGKLLARKTETYYDGATNISEYRTYNSDNSDFLNYTFNGVLTVNFPSTMVIQAGPPTYTLRDYWNYSDYSGGSINAGYYQHGGISTYTDEITNYYTGYPINVIAVDTSNDSATCKFPGSNIWLNESYAFYTTMANRPGDYMQLGSFTLWGNNLYQNGHLCKTITNPGYTTNVTYNIDAYSKITQMTANIVDSLANTRIVTYNLQYETF